MTLAEAMEQFRRNNSEILIKISRAIKPWTKLGMNIFTIEDKDFLSTVD